MGFAPQRRGIFRHLKFKKWPEPMVFCAFWLTKVLRATAACHFSRSELQKSLWTWGVLYFLTCKCASRHSGVPFLDIGTWPAHVVFCVLTCKCAARHSGVPFFDLGTSKISPGMWVFCGFWLEKCVLGHSVPFFKFCATSASAALASLLFEHQEPRIIEKHSDSRLS